MSNSQLEKKEIYIKKIGLKKARCFYREHHYAKGCSNSATSFGVYNRRSEKLLACVSFQTPCSENVRSSVLGERYKRHVAELGRLAIIGDVSLYASMFMSQVIKLYKSDRKKRGLAPIFALVSFADSSQKHHGGVYQSMSWIYTGRSKNTKPVYTDSNGRRRHSRQAGLNISPDQARKRGWSVEKVHGFKYRYIKILRRGFLRELKYKRLPYPKPRTNPQS